MGCGDTRNGRIGARREALKDFSLGAARPRNSSKGADSAEGAADAPQQFVQVIHQGIGIRDVAGALSFAPSALVPYFICTWA
jgi:hypothetical protein